MMINRLLTIFLCALLIGTTCFAQVLFKGLTPGKSTRQDVESALGQPVNKISETLSEYKSDTASEKIFVQYRQSSSIIERIEAVYPDTMERSEVIRSLKLPATSTASQTNTRGRFEEYFENANVVLTYASADASSGVSRIGYFSSDLFESAVANVPRTPQTSNRSNTGTASTAPEKSRAESQPRVSPSTDSQPKDVDITILQPPDSGTPAKEISSPSREQLQSLTGEYEFDPDEPPSFQKVIIDEAGGKLIWKGGSVSYTLIHTGVGKQGDSTAAQTDILQFKLAEKPGVKVQFHLIHNEVIMLVYLEEKGGEMITATGSPKR